MGKDKYKERTQKERQSGRRKEKCEKGETLEFLPKKLNLKKKILKTPNISSIKGVNTSEHVLNELNILI